MDLEGVNWTHDTLMTKLLIIDDDFDFADLTRRRIERLGLTADVHVGARGAMEKLVRGGFDLVILDLKMPDLDGTTVIQMIRTLGSGQIKVMFYSSADNQELRRLAEQHGAQGYLNKNASTGELELRIRQLLGDIRPERKSVAAFPRVHVSSGPAPKPLEPMDRASSTRPSQARASTTSFPAIRRRS
jgi:DNA-binding response OmpR family regulator